MSRIMKIWAAEPAVLISAVRAVLVAAVGFGLHLRPEQITSIVIALEAVFALLTRQSVYAPATVENIVDNAAAGRHRRIEDVDLDEDAL